MSSSSLRPSSPSLPADHLPQDVWYIVFNYVGVKDETTPARPLGAELHAIAKIDSRMKMITANYLTGSVKMNAETLIGYKRFVQCLNKAINELTKKSSNFISESKDAPDDASLWTISSDSFTPEPLKTGSLEELCEVTVRYPGKFQKINQSVLLILRSKLTDIDQKIAIDRHLERSGLDMRSIESAKELVSLSFDVPSLDFIKQMSLVASASQTAMSQVSELSSTVAKTMRRPSLKGISDIKGLASLAVEGLEELTSTTSKLSTMDLTRYSGVALAELAVTTRPTHKAGTDLHCYLFFPEGENYDMVEVDLPKAMLDKMQEGGVYNEMIQGMPCLLKAAQIKWANYLSKPKVLPSLSVQDAVAKAHRQNLVDKARSASTRFGGRHSPTHY